MLIFLMQPRAMLWRSPQAQARYFTNATRASRVFDRFEQRFGETSPLRPYNRKEACNYVEGIYC